MNEQELQRLDQLPPVDVGKVQETMLLVDLRKYLTKTGATFVGIAIILFVVGNLKAIEPYVAAGFAGRAYTFAWWLMVVGAGFASPAILKNILSRGSTSQ